MRHITQAGLFLGNIKTDRAPLDLVELETCAYVVAQIHGDEPENPLRNTVILRLHPKAAEI